MDKRIPDAPDPDEPRGSDTSFRIKQFPDLRTLRVIYTGEEERLEPVEPDEVATANQAEEDLGLTRSTREEAKRFLEEAQETPEDDAMTEFLDDE
ncbi:MAG: hypothetical protein LIP23_09255 [Planctomycetes bacterium]|nr:hypothetical protein [Planctomycetota bacterium]